MELKAERLHSGNWVVRPQGTLGTCGWINGKPWTAINVNARNANEAINKARKEFNYA